MWFIGRLEPGKLNRMNSKAQFFSGLARGLTLLAIGIWIGGMTFFGAVTAPLMFRAARASAAPELAPILVGQMLGRFTFVTYICGALMLLGWLFDGLISLDRRWLWRAQGVVTTICVALAIYLGAVILPRTVAQQDAIVPLFVKDARQQKLTPAEQTMRKAFDVGHEEYQKLGAINVYLLIALLGLIVARTRVVTRPATREH